MSRKDYITIARQYHDYRQRLISAVDTDATRLSIQLAVFDHMVSLSADMMQGDNSHFSRERFMQAVYGVAFVMR